MCCWLLVVVVRVPCPNTESAVLWLGRRVACDHFVTGCRGVGSPTSCINPSRTHSIRRVLVLTRGHADGSVHFLRPATSGLMRKHARFGAAVRTLEPLFYLFLFSPIRSICLLFCFLSSRSRGSVVADTGHDASVVPCLHTREV